MCISIGELWISLIFWIWSMSESYQRFSRILEEEKRSYYWFFFCSSCSCYLPNAYDSLPLAFAVWMETYRCDGRTYETNKGRKRCASIQRISLFIRLRLFLFIRHVSCSKRAEESCIGSPENIAINWVATKFPSFHSDQSVTAYFDELRSSLSSHRNKVFAENLYMSCYIGLVAHTWNSVVDECAVFYASPFQTLFVFVFVSVSRTFDSVIILPFDKLKQGG